MTGANRIGRGIATIARYVLALGMMPYGVTKIWTTQFELGASQYGAELGAIDGASLTWAFLGRSAWFQVLLGVIEVVPCALLLFRRTKTLGAVMMLPPVLGVWLVNVALQLWAETRLVSSVFLALNVVVLLGEQSTLRAALRAMLGAPVEKTRGRRVEAIIGGVLLVGSLVGYSALLRVSIGARNAALGDFIGDRQINGSGAWAVESIVVGDESAPVGAARVTFDFDRHCIVEPLTGDEALRRERRRETRRQCTFAADRAQRTFELHSAVGIELLSDLKGTYEIEQDKLQLVATHDGKPMRVVLRPWRWGSPAAR
jgi:hypothetical protein